MTLTLLDPPPEEPDDGRLAAPDGWPAPPARAAYHGLAGDIVDTIAPHTEADPVAILAQLLVAFGAAAGRGGWFCVEASRHHPNEFLVLVGDSAKARIQYVEFDICEPMLLDELCCADAGSGRETAASAG